MEVSKIIVSGQQQISISEKNLSSHNRRAQILVRGTNNLGKTNILESYSVHDRLLSSSYQEEMSETPPPAPDMSPTGEAGGVGDDAPKPLLPPPPPTKLSPPDVSDMTTPPSTMRRLKIIIFLPLVLILLAAFLLLLSPFLITLTIFGPNSEKTRKLALIFKLPPIALGATLGAALCSSIDVSPSVLMKVVGPIMKNFTAGQAGSFVDDEREAERNASELAPLPFAASNFSIAKELSYFNCGTLGLVPKSTQESCGKIWAFKEADPMTNYYGVIQNLMVECQRVGGEYLGAEYEEITFSPSTTASLNLVWNGFRDGAQFNADGEDVVLYSSQEHPGGLSALKYVASLGTYKTAQVTIPLDCVDLTEEDVVNLYADEIAKHNGRVKAIFTSHISSITGIRYPISKLSKLAHDNGALMVVDGAQGPGGIKVDVKELGCDVYTVSSQKWTMAPTGASLLYVKKEIKEINMRVCAWSSGGSTGDDSPFSNSSFYTHSVGSNSEVIYYGLMRSIEFLNRHGYKEKKIEEYNLRLRDFFVKKLEILCDEVGNGLKVLSPAAGDGNALRR